MATERKTTLSFTDYDLRIVDLALRGYLEGLDGQYDDDHVRMEVIRERVRQARWRMQRLDAKAARDE